MQQTRVGGLVCPLKEINVWKISGKKRNVSFLSLLPCGVTSVHKPVRKQVSCPFKTGNRKSIYGPKQAIWVLAVFGGAWSSGSPVDMAGALEKIPDVEIDPEGTFKYILVRVKVKDGDVQKDIVRGTKSAEYHSKFSAQGATFL